MLISCVRFRRSLFPLSSSLFPLFVFPLFLSGCVVDSSKKVSTADTTHAAPVITVAPVNRGTSGLAERVLWSLSPDGRAILVVADPVGVENEPVANAFFFGDEARGFQTQVDSVWDVSPSPDWKWIGFGRAYSVVGGAGTGSDRLTEVARRTSIDTATLRAGSFASSAMSQSRAVAQPGVIRIPDNPRTEGAVDSAAPRLFPIARGWRVRWTTDGSTLALGNNPGRAEDNEPSQTWAALDPTTGQLHGSLPGDAKLAETKFTVGPTIGGPAPIDMTQAPPIQFQRGNDTYTIESQRGVITITQRPKVAGTTEAQRIVGAGIALAATAGGRYIVALAPKSKPDSAAIAIEPVVYTVTW
ncbi:MAG TPA: hypothetical protein VJV97_07175 [Gemmatimonadaceae bacterium]|nr:hypothetical protein [Gemmatimonadaceae bacterium]